MKQKLIIAILFLFPLLSLGQSPNSMSLKFKKDFEFFWQSIDENYCYFDKKQTDWNKVKEIYEPIFDTISTRDQFVKELENVFYEIYDHHASLNTNTNNSQRLVPSGTDIWAEFINGKPVITEVRKNFGAEVAGVLPGMEVVAVNDIPVLKAIEPFIGKALRSTDTEAKNYALRLLLAGNHTHSRKLTLLSKQETKDYFPDGTHSLLEHVSYAAMIESNIKNSIGYIKINNCLFDNELIAVFDSTMQLMKNTRSLILDLRETPSGGNTSVARAILGWFTNKEQIYQKHELYAEQKETGIIRSWFEIVSPRKNKYYNMPVVLLVDHWTGSIAEGITIAFDGMKRAKIIGTKMAGLNGAGQTFEMPNSKIRFTFPVERLYHITGLPRENFLPSMLIDLLKENNKAVDNIFIDKAFQYLNSNSRK
ncbi:MAG: S41 family peptidase [Ferruginibacter sp.]